MFVLLACITRASTAKSSMMVRIYSETEWNGHMIYNTKRWMTMAVIAVLIVISSIGISSACHYNLPPHAAFSASTLSGAAPLAVNFTDLSTGSKPITCLWNFGDGKNSTAKSPTHTYSKARTYTVTLTATNAAGNNTTIKSNYIVVTDAIPIAAFSASPSSGTSQLTVNFTDLSTGSKPITCLWNFGDGKNSTAISPTHTYSKAGTYTVTLTATNAAGNNTTIKSNYIVVTDAIPIAAFSASTLSGATPLAVQFTDQSTGSNPITCLWNFGDGKNSTAISPIHTYSTAGTYTVTLTATNAAGNNTTIKSNCIVVTDAIPIAAFSASTLSGATPLTVQFTDQSTGSNPITCLWNFGDGKNSTAKSPTHTYSKTGTYTVTLTATNAAGSNTTTEHNYIIVTDAIPIAAFSASTLSGAAPLAVQFTDQSTGSNPITCLWNFGDGKNSTAKSPTYTYSKTGIYTVTLTATNAAGSNTKTMSNYIKIN